MKLNRKNRSTLKNIYRKPTSSSIAWSDVEALFVACGAEVVERRGSRIAILLDGHILHFHRPHPGKEARRYQIDAARNFLRRLGVTP